MKMQYSDRAKQAYAKLYSHYNDIDIYVEDRTCRNMYEYLLRRMLPAGFTLYRVIQLGDKSTVLQRAREHDPNDERPHLYIIDGDLDVLRDKRRGIPKNTYRLAVYCSENLLFDDKSLCELARETLSNSSFLSAKTELNLQEVWDDIDDLLKLIFYIYALVFRLSLNIDTISYSVHRLCYRDSNNVLHVSRTLAFERAKFLVREMIRRVGIKRYRLEKTKLARITRKRIFNGCHVVSGKDYIFPLIENRLKFKADYHHKGDALKVALAKTCRTDIDPGLRRAIRRATKRVV